MLPIIDIHSHILPGVDDGARDMEEALLMLKMHDREGVRDIFCTSHSFCDIDAYGRAFEELVKRAFAEGIEVRLHKGCEVLCSGDEMSEVLDGLKRGLFPTLGDTEYVLVELYEDAMPSEALAVIRALKGGGYKPIIAHMERCYNISPTMVGVLVGSGAMIQVNAYSLAEEGNEGIRESARSLLKRGYVHFIGSDAHRPCHRPPSLRKGAEYILDTIGEDGARDILYRNAERLLIGG